MGQCLNITYVVYRSFTVVYFFYSIYSLSVLWTHIRYIFGVVPHSSSTKVKGVDTTCVVKVVTVSESVRVPQGAPPSKGKGPNVRYIFRLTRLVLIHIFDLLEIDRDRQR